MRLKISSILLLIISGLFLTLHIAHASYTPLEKIPGFDAGTDFYTYIQAVYNFLIWGVGVSALLMISIGGFMYITAAGNSSSMNSAKEVISDAIYGLVLALIAYLFLYVINPDLVNIKKLSKITTDAATSSSSSGASPTGGSSATLPSGCSNYEKAFDDASGGDANKKCLLKAIAGAESTCNPNATSSVGACGMMQLLPSTAGKTCDELKSDPNGSIQRAAALLDSSRNNLPSGAGNNFSLSDSVDSFGYNTGNDDLIASYNAGTKNGGKGPFTQSADCPTAGVYKWNCPTNPQGFAETQTYVRRVQSMQKQCLNGNS